MPRVYVIQSEQPNAFATGRNPNNAAVAASAGLLRMLSKEEVAGVLAHELAHVKNRDTLTMTVAATIAGAISMLANFGMLFGGGRRDGESSGPGIVGTLLAVLWRPWPPQSFKWRSAGRANTPPTTTARKYASARFGSRRRCSKIDNAARQIPNEQAEAHPASAPLYIVNPLTGGGMDNLFSTHPNTENRIAALEALAQQMGQTAAAARRRCSVCNPVAPQTTAASWRPEAAGVIADRYPVRAAA